MSVTGMRSRRGFLGSLAGFSLGTMAPRAWAKGAVKTISIIHTTDLHGHIMPSTDYRGQTGLGGLARCASQIRMWQKMCPNNLLVDVGDLYQGTPASRFSQGEMMIDLLNMLGYDCWTLGNHEFDWGMDVVERAAQRSKMPVLTANIEMAGHRSGRWPAGHALGNIHPYRMMEVAGIKIGLVGLITPGLPYWLRPELLKGIKPIDPVESLSRAVSALQAEGAHAIVVTGHMGFKFRDDYANPLRHLLGKVRGIDLYIGGHSHRDMPAWKSSGVMCTQSSYHGMHCGRVDLTFDLETKKLVSKHLCTNLMDDRFQLDPLVLKSASKHLDFADKQMSRKVATLKQPIRQDKGEVRELLCKAFLYAAKKRKLAADTVFHGTFSKGDIPAGELTMEQVWHQLPYENWLVSVEVTAREMAEIVAEVAKDKYSDKEVYGFQARKEDDYALRDRKGKLLQPDQRLTVLFNSYDAQSGGRRYMRLREITQQKSARSKMLPVDTRDALTEYFLDGQPAP